MISVFFFLPPPTGDPATSFREVNPYGPSTAGFNTSLVVEVNPAVLASNPVLAVSPGVVVVVPDPTPATTVTLVLRPGVEAIRGDQPGELQLAVVYRNIDKASVRGAFTETVEALGEKGFLQDLTVGERLDLFVSGAFAIFVAGGADLGLPSTSNGVGGWGRVGFEVVYAPGGLGLPGGARFGSNEGWQRLLQLIAPGAPTRRLDPLDFYRRLAALMAPAHVLHPLLTFLTRQALIELRDEYDAPYAGSVQLTDGSSGVTTTPTIPASDRGTLVIERVASGTLGTPATTSYTLQLGSHLFTELPSGIGTLAAPNKTLTAPFHWALQHIFMDDVENTDNWYVANGSLPRFSSGNRITPLVDGLETLDAYTNAIRTLTSAGHRMLLAAYDLFDDFSLVPKDAGSTFQFMTNAAASVGAKVYAMVWDKVLAQNTAEVAHINALPSGNGKAILDNETLSGGSHHQKFLIIEGNKGVFAFCGGVDIRQNRLDSPNHGAPSAYHDVHAAVEGPAVEHIYKAFVERWNAHPNKPLDLPTAPPTVPATSSDMFVQVARTYAPRLSTQTGIPSSMSCLNGFLRAVGKARKFIYIEDQFLTPYPDEGGPDSLGVLTALLAALPRIDYLIIVVSNHIAMSHHRSHQQDFLTPLVNAAPDKVFPFFLDRSEAKPTTKPGEEATTWCEYVFTGNHEDFCSGEGRFKSEIYCHSKVWMVDDVAFKIGSANCNRRSYTHDTEMDLIVVDGALSEGARAAARRFRLKLWGEHLDMTTRAGLLADHKHALFYWQHPRPRAHILPYDLTAPDTDIFPPLSWSTSDPDGR